MFKFSSKVSLSVKYYFTNSETFFFRPVDPLRSLVNLFEPYLMFKFSSKVSLSVKYYFTNSETFFFRPVDPLRTLRTVRLENNVQTTPLTRYNIPIYGSNNSQMPRNRTVSTSATRGSSLPYDSRPLSSPSTILSLNSLFRLSLNC